MSFNRIILVGFLGKDPDLRYTPQGKAVANFSLATNEKKTDKSGEKVDVTTWFKITLWGNQAENASKYLSKGSPVYIEGRLGVEEWTDRENEKRYTLAVNATDMQFIGSGKSDGGDNVDRSAGYDQIRQSSANDFPSRSGAAPAPPPLSPAVDDDIPF